MLSKLLPQLLTLAIFCALVFVPAGTLDWPEGWVFILLFIACSVIMSLWLLKTDPALLVERMKSPMSGAQEPRDVVIMLCLVIGMCLWLAFMGLDARRFGWSYTPPWAQGVGAGLMVLCFVGWADVLRANSFAATQVRLQPERGQSVISTGPYAIVRHPMYAWALVLMIAAPLLLGSLWGLLGILVFAPLLGLRAKGEEAVLMQGLDGYPEYAAKVRYRLVPGVW